MNAVTDGVTIAGGDNVSVATAGNTVTISASGADLADDAVTSAKIADGTIVSVDLAADAVTTAELQDAAVTGTKLAAGSAVLSLNAATDAITLVEGSNITIATAGQNITISASGGSEVGAGDLADNSVTGAKIVDASLSANIE